MFERARRSEIFAEREDMEEVVVLTVEDSRLPLDRQIRTITPGGPGHGERQSFCLVLG